MTRAHTESSRARGAARPRLTRKERREQTRQALIESAELELLAGGVFDASLRRICARAGFTLGAFYSNFADKDELMMAVADAHVDRLFARLDERDADGADMTAAWLAELEADRVLADLFLEFTLYARRHERFRALYAARKRQWYERLARALARRFARAGREPFAPPARLALGFSALWHGLALEAVVSGSNEAASLIPLFLNALIQAAPPAPEEP